MNNSSNQTTGILTELNIPFIIIIYICSFIGIILNVMLCAIIWNRKCLHQSLNLLIANLALCDIGYCLTSIYSVTLICVALYNPQSFIQLPKLFLNNICQSLNFFRILSTGNSMATLAIISIDRLRGIIYPLKIQFSKNLTKIMIAFTWIYATIPALLLVCFSSYENHEVIDCSAILVGQIKIIDTILILNAGVMCCIVPLIVIITCYISITIKICQKSPPMDDSEYKSKVMKSIKKRNRCIVALLAITIISSLACCPFLGVLNWIMFEKLADSQFSSKLSNSTWEFFRLSLIINSLPTILNPILYNFANSQLRKEVNHLFRKLKFDFCCTDKIRKK